MADNQKFICPLMTTGFTYRHCITDGCALWSKVFGTCAILAAAEPWNLAEDSGSDAEDAAWVQ